MNATAKIISMLALALTIVPSFLFAIGVVDHAAVKILCLVGTIFWFVATPLWMGRELPVDAGEVEI